jgi:hypothetical protein
MELNEGYTEELARKSAQVVTIQPMRHPKKSIQKMLAKNVLRTERKEGR